MYVTMLYALIGIVFFLVLVLVAVRMSITRKRDEELVDEPTIHASGIYSIVRKTPRETISERKPSRDELRQYLRGINEDIEDRALSDSDKNALIEQWDALLEENISQIERGDRENVAFYYFEYPDSDSVCARYVDNGQFVTREEIYQHSEVIPPFHLGCSCRIVAYHGNEDLSESTQVGMRPFFRDETLPPLPNWQDTVKTT